MYLLILFEDLLVFLLKLPLKRYILCRSFLLLFDTILEI